MCDSRKVMVFSVSMLTTYANGELCWWLFWISWFCHQHQQWRQQWVLGYVLYGYGNCYTVVDFIQIGNLRFEISAHGFFGSWSFHHPDLTRDFGTNNIPVTTKKVFHGQVAKIFWQIRVNSGRCQNHRKRLKEVVEIVIALRKLNVIKIPDFYLSKIVFYHSVPLI